MKQSFSSILFVAGLCLLLSCKKKNTDTVKTNQTTTPTPYGQLTTARAFMCSGSSLSFMNNFAYGNFRSDVNSIATLMQVGAVWANGTKLKYDISSKEYNDTTYSIQIVPTTWQVTGVSPIPSFTYTDNDSLPGYTGCTLLPDTIYKNQGVTLQINGVSNANNIDVSFYNSTNSTNVYKPTAQIASVNNTISFSASELSPLPTSSGVTFLNVNITKDNAQAFSNTTIDFQNQLQITKQVYIK